MKTVNNIADFGIPANDEIEITTIGGGINGESIVVHIGNGHWVIIDSCTFPKDKKTPLALKYLKEIGVTPKDSVLEVVCTHWHLDHINGLNNIVYECENARLFMPNVGNASDYIRLILPETVDTETNSQILEIFDKSIEIIKGREKNNWPIYTTCNSQIAFTDFPDKTQVELLALSPSHQLQDDFSRKLVDGTAESLTEDIKKRILNPNLCSIACILRTPNFNAVIGGDLEKQNADDSVCAKDCNCPNRLGWCSIYDTSTAYQYNQSFDNIKIPHHSSVTGYCPRLWDTNSQKPIATSTLYSKGSKLPISLMMQIYLSRTEAYFLTGTHNVSKQGDKSDPMDALTAEALISQEQVKDFGIVVTRRKLDADSWTVQGYGASTEVTQGLIEQYKSMEQHERDLRAAKRIKKAKSVALKVSQ